MTQDKSSYIGHHQNYLCWGILTYRKSSITFTLFSVNEKECSSIVGRNQLLNKPAFLQKKAKGVIDLFFKFLNKLEIFNNSDKLFALQQIYLEWKWLESRLFFFYLVQNGQLECVRWMVSETEAIAELSCSKDHPSLIHYAGCYGQV